MADFLSYKLVAVGGTISHNALLACLAGLASWLLTAPETSGTFRNSPGQPQNSISSQY